MTRISTTLFRFSIATILGGGALLWSGQLTLNPMSSLVSPACAQTVDVYGRVVTVCR